jgi:hypothetical protein
MRWRFVLAYVSTAVVVATFLEIKAMPGQVQYQALVSHGIHTSGQVVADDVHGGLGYAFVAQGKSYPDSGSSVIPRGLQLGDTVPVVYEESNPANNCSCDPGEELIASQRNPILLALFISLLAPFAYWQFRPLWTGQGSPSGQIGRLMFRVGPPSRFLWWAVSAVLLSVVSSIASRLVQPVIYWFVVIPVLGLSWVPLGVVMDRLLTPLLRRFWPHPRR